MTRNITENSTKTVQSLLKNRTEKQQKIEQKWEK